MKRIMCWFRAFRKLKTVEDVKSLGLHFRRNIYGDEINHIDCRSLWSDDYLNIYRCNCFNFLASIIFLIFNKFIIVKIRLLKWIIIDYFKLRI